MVEIKFLAESDRGAWDVLIRGKDAYFATVRTDDDYERAWRRLRGGETRGIGAWLDGKMVGVAHYVFHASVWGINGRCYLADLFVDTEVRRRGVATAVIRWVARDAEEHGFRSLYWNTLEDAEARSLYDRLGTHLPGFIHYSYRRDPGQAER